MKDLGLEIRVDDVKKRIEIYSETVSFFVSLCTLS